MIVSVLPLKWNRVKGKIVMAVLKPFSILIKIKMYFLPLYHSPPLLLIQGKVRILGIKVTYLTDIQVTTKTRKIVNSREGVIVRLSVVQMVKTMAGGVSQI
jgi:hypothetical protein